MDGMSVQEAAEYLGINEKTVRRRIQLGEIPAVKVARRQGYTWRVYPDGLPPDVSYDHVDTRPSQVDAHPRDVDPPHVQVETGEMVRLIEKLYADNQQLAGQVGFLQAKLQDAQEENQQLRLLMAPKDEPAEPEPPAEPVRVSWWRRIWGG
jgi:excisionase family DNA binding protein